MTVKELITELLDLADEGAIQSNSCVYLDGKDIIAVGFSGDGSSAQLYSIDPLTAHSNASNFEPQGLTMVQ